MASAVVPYITAARARGDLEGAGRYVSVGIRLSALISLPAALGMSVLSRPILSMLFVGDADMAEHAGAPLSLLSLAIFLLGLLAITNSVLQAYKKQGAPLVSMLCGVAVKIAVLYLLTPLIGPLAAPVGTVLFYLTAVCINLYCVFRYAAPVVDWYRAFLVPTLAALAAAFTAYGAYRLFGSFSDTVGVLFAIAAAAPIYLALVLLFGVVSAEDLVFLPHGERILNFLTKHHVLKKDNV